MQPSMKPWYLSKTLYMNLIFGVLVLIWPKAGDYLSPEIMGSIIAAANVVLRLVTKDKLTIG